MDERPPIRSAQQIVPDNALIASMGMQLKAVEEAIKAAMDDLKTEGVEDFSEVRVERWYDNVNQREVLWLVVPGHARPEDW